MTRPPFHILRVEENENVFVDDRSWYHDACLLADIACTETRIHHVVWDSRRKIVLYDSRLIANKLNM